MSIQTYAEFLKNFFEEERKKLSENYPGLTLHRLRLEAPARDLEELYFPSVSHVFNQFIIKVKNGIPLEYISKRAYFYRSYFFVDKRVLIPRNETEILVELASEELGRNYKNKPCHVLDVCTGSGAIGLSLLREGNAQFSMILSDLSEEALSVAKVNYFQMQFLFSPESKVQFIKSDRLQNIQGVFDLILSNPPYIKSNQDRSTVHQQVLNHEPELALFIDDLEYEKWFSEFFTEIYEHLASDGLALIEGHENHLALLKELALKIGFNTVSIIQDYSQRNRFLRLKK